MKLLSSATLLLLALIFFFLAITSYAIYIFRLRKPVSYFDLITKKKSGDKSAKLVLIFWNLAISFSVIFGASLLVSFFF